MTSWQMRDRVPNRHPFVGGSISFPLQLAWRTKVVGRVVAPAIATEDAVYVPTVGRLYRIDPRTGDILWEFKTYQARRAEEHCHMIGSPAIWRDRIYFTDESFLVYCLERHSGEVLWETTKLWSQNESICVYGDRLFLKTRHVGREEYSEEEPGYLCLDPDGEIVWLVRSRGAISTMQPAVADNILVFGDEAGYVYGIHVDDGRIAWQADTDSLAGSYTPPGKQTRPYLLPTIVGSTIVVAVGSPRVLAALDLASGEAKWTYVSEWPTAHAAADDRHLYFVALRQKGITIDCVDLADGRLLWSTDQSSWNLGAAGVYSTSGLVAGGHYITGFATSSTLAAFSTGDGSMVWRFAGEGGFSAGPILVNRRLVIGAQDEHVYCFEEASSTGESAR